MDNQNVFEILEEYGIKTERELDAALKKTSFSLGIMAAGALAPVPLENMKGESNND